MPANIQAILEETGSSLDKLVYVTVVMADEDDFVGMNAEWLKWFPSNPPAQVPGCLRVFLAFRSRLLQSLRLSPSGACVCPDDKPCASAAHARKDRETVQKLVISLG
ncbi:MAG: RidA family protein [Aeromicrobium sp.]|nr:RidA family protein [Burkholderiales bacterium]